ncbi:hypothetical protein BOX15_Mlig004430g2, partial [Macrostomum lignano]
PQSRAAATAKSSQSAMLRLHHNALLAALIAAIVSAGSSVWAHSVQDPMGVHSPEHLAQHMRDIRLSDSAGPGSQQEQQEYYYFKLHDFDNNGRLDGAELVKSLLDHGSRGHSDSDNSASVVSDHNLESTVDQILRDEDTNGDGYVDYTEFVAAQRRNSKDH